MRADITFHPMTDSQIAALTPDQVKMWVRDCERLRDENKKLRRAATVDHTHYSRDIKPVGECPGCDQSRRWGLLRAALNYADLELLSRSVAAPARGLREAHEDFLNSIKAMIGVDHARWNEHGHISYRMQKYKEERGWK